MTKCLRLALTVITVTATFITTQAQNVAINNTGATAATTAILDASSTTKGILVPRMDKTEKNAIALPANALLIYQTGPDSVGFHYYDLPNTQWVYINPSGFANDTTAWKITGNSNITAANFLGTTNDTALFFRIKNKESGVIDSISAATALGYQSLPNLGNAGQLHNSAFGYKSLLSNTTGSSNTALGSNTLRLHRTGNFNTAVGMLSMQIDTTGFYNTAIGYNALFGNTKGVENVGLGVQTNYYGDSTNYTTAVGTNAAFYNRRNNTTAVGHGALFFNSYGSNSAPFISTNLDEGKSNTAIGFQSQYYMNRGSRNTSLGYRSHIGQGFFNPATVRNVAIGDSALAGNFGAGNTAVGSVALGKNNGNQNTAVGDSAMALSDNISSDVAIGTLALSRHTNGGYANTAVGYYSQRDSSKGTFYNTSLGAFSMEFNRIGVYNTGLGLSALRLSDSASYNTAIGADAMYNHRKNASNVAIGAFALRGDSAGYWNTSVGSEAMDRQGFDGSARGTGFSNVAVGFRALRQVREGFENTAVGVGALENDSSGNYNTAVGRYSGFLNKRGNYNTSMGMESGVSNDTASSTTAVGYVAGYYNKNNYNTAYGAFSLSYNNFTTGPITTGAENTGLGYGAAYLNNLGSKNTAVGFQAMNGNGVFGSGNRNVAVGDSALFSNSTANNNVGIGFKAGAAIRDGSDNIAIGDSALTANVAGSQHVAIGTRALSATTASYPNTAIGYLSMDSVTTGGANTALGSYTLSENKTGINNTAIGNASMYQSTAGSNNTAVGNDAGRLIRNNFNTALGASSLRNDTTGTNNVAVGFQSLFIADSASDNVAIGVNALYYNRADSNTAVGRSAGANVGFNILYRPKEVTFIGALAGTGAFTSDKNTAVGFRALSNRNGGTIWDYIGPGRNTAIGDSAMAFSVGISNVAVGAQSLSNAGVGNNIFNNVAIGDSAMGNAKSDLNSLFDNTVIGYKSGSQLRNHGNVTMGAYSGQKLANTVWNTAIGYHALEVDTTGSENTVIGTSAFRSNFNGIRNVSLGINTGYWATGSNNTYLGSYAGQGVADRSTGGSNVAVGNFALYAARSSSQNVAIGESALGADSIGNLNVAIGAGAMDQHLRGNENVGIGFWAGRGDTASLNSVYVGSQAGYNNNRSSTVAIGYQALYNNSLGATPAQALNNLAVGSLALTANTLGSSNTAVGNSALNTNSSGNQNTGLGYLSNVSVSNLVNATAIGANALIAQNNSMVLGSINGVNSATATTSVGIGLNTPSARLHVRRNGASGGPFIGNASMIIEDNTQSYVQLSNPTNSENGILSGNALTSIRSGIVFGIDSAMFLRTGGNTNRMLIDNSGYIGVGTTAPNPLTQLHLYEPLNANVNLRVASVGASFEPGLELVKTTTGGSDWKLRVTTGGSLVYSRSTDDFVTPTDEYQMSAASFIPTTDNSNSLGALANRWTTVYATVGAINTSDARDKENISDLNYGLKEVMKLRPVSYTWKENPQWGKKIGFIAQEVQPVLKEVIQIGELKSKKEALNDDGTSSLKETDKLGIYYSDIIPVAVKAIQEQQTQIEKISKENEALKKKNEQLENDIKAIKAKLGIQ